MTDTQLINTINNHLSGGTLKVYKQDGVWTAKASFGWHDIQSTRDTLRDSLDTLLTNLKQRSTQA